MTGVSAFKKPALFLFIIFSYLQFAGATDVAVQSHSVRIYTAEFQNKLKNIGVSQAIMRIFQNRTDSGGFYFQNSQFKTFGKDLEAALIASEKSGIQLTAWMITRNYKWLKDKSLFDVSYKNDKSVVIPKLDIFNEKSVELVKRAYRDLVKTGVKSVMLQDDAVLKRTEGLSEKGKNFFHDKTGYPPVEKHMLNREHFYFHNWIRIKINRINSLIETVVNECRKSAPGKIEVGMNIYYETPVFTNNSEQWYSHNLSELLLTGIDKVYLMGYHRQIKKEMKYSETQNQVFFRNMVKRAYRKAGGKLVVKMQIRDWKTGQRIPFEEMKNYIKQIPSGVEKICFTPIKKEDIDYLKKLVGYVKTGARIK